MCGYKDQQEGPYGDRNILYPHWINVDILAVTLCYSFARCYHSRNLDKGTLNLSVLSLTTSFKTTIVSK